VRGKKVTYPQPLDVDATGRTTRGALAFPLLGAWLVAHVGGAGKVVPRDLLRFLDVGEGLLARPLLDGGGEIQPRGERPSQLLVGQGAHLALEPGHLLLTETGPQVVDHQGYELVLSSLATCQLGLLVSLGPPSLHGRSSKVWSLVRPRAPRSRLSG